MMIKSLKAESAGGAVTGARRPPYITGRAIPTCQNYYEQTSSPSEVVSDCLQDPPGMSGTLAEHFFILFFTEDLK